MASELGEFFVPLLSSMLSLALFVLSMGSLTLMVYVSAPKCLSEQQLSAADMFLSVFSQFIMGYIILCDHEVILNKVEWLFQRRFFSYFLRERRVWLRKLVVSIRSSWAQKIKSFGCRVKTVDDREFFLRVQKVCVLLSFWLETGVTGILGEGRILLKGKVG